MAIDRYRLVGLTTSLAEAVSMVGYYAKQESSTHSDDQLVKAIDKVEALIHLYKAEPKQLAITYFSEDK